MRTHSRSLLWIPLLLISACAASPELPLGHAIGETLEPQTSVPFAVVDAAPEHYFDRVVLVEATVVAVCPSAGCWMQIEDAGRRAMVRWQSGCGGRYVFPVELTGERILIQGSFYPMTLTEEQVANLEVEANGAIEAEREGFEFNASAILVLD